MRYHIKITSELAFEPQCDPGQQELELSLRSLLTLWNAQLYRDGHAPTEATLEVEVMKGVVSKNAENIG